MQYMYLSYNQLTGTLPASWSTLTSLKVGENNVMVLYLGRVALLAHGFTLQTHHNYLQLTLLTACSPHGLLLVDVDLLSTAGFIEAY